MRFVISMRGGAAVPFIALFAFLLAALLPSTARAVGPMGRKTGWAVDNSGNPLLTSSLCATLSAGGTGWVNIEFRMLPGHTTWDSTMMAYYDTVVNNCKAAGIQMIGLLEAQSIPGTQTDWCANNWENDHGDGTNPYITSFINVAARPLVSHFHDRIKYWEVWNEPNSWTSNPSAGVYTGGSYIYPSNYSQLLAGVFDNVKEYDGHGDVSILFGGVFGHSIGGVYSYTNAGAQYIDDTYNVGIHSVGSFAYTKNRWGVYPLDGVCEHLYIDQGGTTTSAHVQQYFDWVRSAYTAYEGTTTTKQTFITEFGWETTNVTPAVQSANLKTAFDVIVGTSYIQSALWFEWADNPAASLYYGVVDSSGTHKTAYANYASECTFQGEYSNRSSNANIGGYYNARGQAVLGNPYNNAGGAWVHTWASGGWTANVQDYDGGSHLKLTLFDSTSGTFEVDDIHGFETYYLAHGGIGVYGPPTGNQYASGGGQRQDFQSGHYLTYDSVNGVVSH